MNKKTKELTQNRIYKKISSITSVIRIRMDNKESRMKIIKRMSIF